MCGSFGKQAIDAHGISMQMAAFTYMFASGVSGAATIRVGQLYAAKQKAGTYAAGIATFKIVFVVMAFFGFIFLALNKVLPYAFTSSEIVANTSSGLLLIAAVFQLFDGIQVAGLGILRGMEDVKFPTVITLIGYWGIALPLAWFLAFVVGWKIYGIWIALCVSLIFVAFNLFFRFRRIARK